MDTIADDLEEIEHDLLKDRFVDFERGVLQDNIVLCDAKSGVLLAFDGAMVIFCIEAFVGRQEAGRGAATTLVTQGAFVLAALLFLLSCHFSLTTVLPRLKRGRSDHIFWESPVFQLPVEEYVRGMLRLDPAVQHREKLRHLHMLAGICRSKFAHFQRAMRLGQAAFVTLVVAELLRGLP